MPKKETRPEVLKLEREIEALRRRRMWFEDKTDWSSVARKRAIRMIDRSTRVKTAELDRLKTG